MRLAVLKERLPGETRVAATPETVKKLIALGHSIAIETGAGAGASLPDDLFTAAGATIAANAAEAARSADLILKVRKPTSEELALLAKGQGVVALLDPYADKAGLDALAEKGVVALAMEFVPRITRAQSMDALSSQSNLAGYRAVIEAAELF
ncbi:MAG TPA: NAD(P)(+) transhydrogenase (Re/Si-specific) subunit alpha, partial [Caulobacterales bacterium]|nr:NAD(P)(+) transhydrogenase (Re/Si-specific) subunit alpha [Caulobacterales bacterium]